MIDSASITNEERELLSQYLKKASGSIRNRTHCILLSCENYTPYQISKVLFVAEKTAREWIKKWHQVRMASLFSGNFKNQNAAKLTKKQKQEIKKALQNPPSEYGIPREFWDISALKSFVSAYFSIIYESESSYHFLFHASGFSFKLPATFDLKRNDEEVQKRVEQIRKTITPLFSDPSWVILAEDETRVEWESVIRRCWLPKGEKSILKIHRESSSQCFIGFLNLKTGKPHVYTVVWQNQKEVIKTLKKIQQEYLDKKLCIIWDNAPFHRGKLMQEALKTELKGTLFIALPPYAPDTNPQEHVWQFAKNHIANKVFLSLQAVTRSFKNIVMSRTYSFKF